MTSPSRRNRGASQEQVRDVDLYDDGSRPVRSGGGGGGGSGVSACVTIILTTLVVAAAAVAVGKIYLSTVENSLNLQCTIDLKDAKANAVAEHGKMKSKLKRDLQTAHGCYLHVRTLSFYLMQNAPKSKQAKSTVGKIMNIFAGNEDSATPSDGSNFDPQVFSDCMLEMDVIEHWLQEDSGSRSAFKPKERVADLLRREREAKRLEFEAEEEE